MTDLQREMARRSAAISTMGYLMTAGVVDIIPPDVESFVQQGLVAMLEANEHDKRLKNTHG